MDRYYYLVSQLPVLSFDKESLMDTDSFLKEASIWMGKRHYRMLSQISLFDIGSDFKKPRFWVKYLEFEKIFRNEVAAWRKSHRTGQDLKPENFPLSLVKEGNPLDIEKKLLYWRWQYLDRQEREHHFDLDFLIIYFLKLQILKQLSLFDKEKGMEIFQNLEHINRKKEEQDKADQQSELENKT